MNAQTNIGLGGKHRILIKLRDTKMWQQVVLF
jgi:hypothetical protein